MQGSEEKRKIGLYDSAVFKIAASVLSAAIISIAGLIYNQVQAHEKAIALLQQDRLNMIDLVRELRVDLKEFRADLKAVINNQSNSRR